MTRSGHSRFQKADIQRYDRRKDRGRLPAPCFIAFLLAAFRRQHPHCFLNAGGYAGYCHCCGTKPAEIADKFGVFL
jgi:hypothetical protein